MDSEGALLVAVDFSEASSKAVKHAAALARALQAKVVLVHAFAKPIRAPTLATSLREGPYVPILEAEAEMQFEEAISLTERWAKPLRDEGLAVDVVAEPGMTPDVILAAAKQLDPIMIVMGRQGHGRLRRIVVGSQTRYVTEHSSWPVLIVPT